DRRSRSPPDTPSTLTAPTGRRSTETTDQQPDPERSPRAPPATTEAHNAAEHSGRLPPASATNLRSDEFRPPRCLAMRLTGTPASRISQIVFLSSSENRTTTTPPDRRHHCPPIRPALR